MKKGKQNIITSIVIFGFLLTTIFSCIFALQSFAIEAGNSHASKMAPCCEDAYIFGSNSHNIPFILETNNILQALAMVVFICFYIRDNKEYSRIFSKYLKRYNRWKRSKLFYYFIILFKKGILHPKVY